jgi:hypothetical protein
MVRDIPSAVLRKLIKMTERKEALMGQIQEIDRKMITLERQLERGGSKKKQARRRTGKRIRR